MENHPIPQDITGFKFKLIGDMTLKQFAYVAGGVIFAWVFYISPLYFIIKLPISIFSLAFGLSLAFLPVSGRPFDVMIENFFIAVFSPTQYIYQKMQDVASLQQNPPQQPQSFKDLSRQQFKNFIGSLPVGKKDKLDEKETIFFQNVSAYSSSPAVHTQVNPQVAPSHAFADKAPAQAPKAVDAKNPKNQTPNEELLKKEAFVLEKQIEQAKEKQAKEPTVSPKEYLDAHQKVLELQQNLSNTQYEKQDLEKRLIELQQKMQSAKTPVFSPSLAKQEPQQETKFVRSIPQAMAKNVGLPIAPEFPNVVTGIIKDPRGNPLPNILVEVKDSEENAVRAFKTNALGQFASATPLTSGKYSISFEDPKNENKFDAVSFEANGQIILPIEVISVDSREELRRSLFSN